MASFEVKVIDVDKKPVQGTQVRLEFTDSRPSDRIGKPKAWFVHKPFKL